MSGQTGRIVGTIAGAALAYFTGGASYVALGATLGGVVGSMLDPKAKIEGPRLDDLKVQFSSYGVGIPRIYGTERVGGNVIWSTDKLEIASVTSSGKGGGGTENTNYKYYVHMSMLLCETPRDGSTVSIVKFFQDGKLIWDASSGIPIGSALASAENPYSAFVLFQGHQDQLPDAIEESWTGGPGTCSAYRGVVRIRMIAIECPGGRVPQFSFVLSNGATVGPTVVQQIANTPSASNTGALIRHDGIWEFTTTQNGAVFDMPYSFGQTGTLQTVSSVSFPTGGYTPYPVTGATATPQVIAAYPNGDLYLIDLQSRVQVLLYSGGTGGQGVFYGRASYDATVDKYVINSWDLSTTGNNPVIISAPGAPGVVCDPIAGDGHGGVVGFYGGVVHVVTTNGTNLIYSRRNSDGTASVDMPDMAGPALSFSPRWSALHVDSNGVYLYVVPDAGMGPPAAIYKIHPSTFTDPGSFALLCSSTGPSTQTVFGSSSKSFYCTDTLATIGPIVGGGATGYNLIRFNVVSTNPYKVSDIIEAECELAGVATYDVSGIPDSDTVIGYKLANPASARANIEPLLTLIGGYVVDEDGASKFRKFADITSVAAVTFDELGQAEGDASGEAMPLNRTQEIDLPRSVTTSYINPSSDYQTASETEIRQVTDATEDAQIQLPICVTSDQAKKVSQMVLYDRWRRQNSRSTTVSRKFAAVSPGDGVTIEYPRGTFKLWLVLSTNDTGAVCEWSLCPGDAAICTQTAIGATGYTSQQVAALPAPLRAQILDMPIVRDADNDAGLYVALDSYAPVPADGELYVGDDDTNLVSRGTVSASAPIGFPETVLVGWSSTLVDETNTFTVNLGDDVFSSVTRDVLLAGGAEYWAYGAPGRWEIGASAQGDSLGSGRYILSRHLRGLFGTERFVGTHTSSDTLVLLRIAGMLRPDTGVGSIGQNKSYRAIAKGRSVDSAASQTYANTGEGLTPLSPVNLRRTDTNDFTVDRRSRLAMNNLTGALPLGETTEAYSWAFYSSGAYTTLLGTVVTNTATVTAAQITAIGVTPSATAFLKVRQVSDSIGPGHELQATA
jgi:hypothetical protein